MGGLDHFGPLQSDGAAVLFEQLGTTAQEHRATYRNSSSTSSQLRSCRAMRVPLSATSTERRHECLARSRGPLSASSGVSSGLLMVMWRPVGNVRRIAAADITPIA